MKHTPESLHYCADCHSHCTQTIEAQEQVALILAALKHVIQSYDECGEVLHSIIDHARVVIKKVEGEPNDT